MDNLTDFQFSILSPADKIADHLEALARAFRAKRIEFRAGDQDLVLAPEGDLDFYLKAYRRGTRNKVSFDIKWKNQPDTMVELDIRAGEDEDDQE
jgi:amphi-Trp domain-containing protein